MADLRAASQVGHCVLMQWVLHYILKTPYEMCYRAINVLGWDNYISARSNKLNTHLDGHEVRLHPSVEMTIRPFDLLIKSIWLENATETASLIDT